jgi:hypothetical protein
MSNILVSATNLFGIIPICIALENENYICAVIAFCAMFASIIYHMSETRHGLPGIFLKKHSEKLLLIDRIFAVIAMIYGLYLLYMNKNIYLPVIILKIIIAISAGCLSEIFGKDPVLYTMFHSIWHCIVFLILGDII